MSRFIQSYNQHLTDAERAGETIVLEQRAGRPSWVLEPRAQVQAAETATDFLSAALAALVHDEGLALRFPDALASTLPWVAFLPDEDRAAFASDAAETLRACVSIGRYTAFATLIEDWRNTAEIWSDPELARSLDAPIDEPLDVAVDGD